MKEISRRVLIALIAVQLALSVLGAYISLSAVGLATPITGAMVQEVQEGIVNLVVAPIVPPPPPH